MNRRQQLWLPVPLNTASLLSNQILASWQRSTFRAIVQSTMSNFNEDRQLCARCGGQCCRTKPGIEEPERFLNGNDLTDGLEQALTSSNWVMEEHLGIPYGPGETAPDPDRLIRYPRPATLAEQQQPGISPLPGSGVCVFLTDSGCRLPFAERPRLCRELVPDVCFECESPWGRREAALAWLPWQDQVTDLLARLSQTEEAPSWPPRP